MKKKCVQIGLFARPSDPLVVLLVRLIPDFDFGAMRLAANTETMMK